MIKIKTCINCVECKKTGKYHYCIAEDDKVRLPIQNFTTDHSDCALFEEV